ncbi:hypothetical protein EVAR_20254_1 [Eumeta japonica]|uniref:Uncharacterized protein n=1 Tax=Eumeta variegata TaxID=151549 RepID=A0A4C1W9P7_EUMVA|nr:hypothetical protein EVAR_20254_1 [Eumeta japonica]
MQRQVLEDIAAMIEGSELEDVTVEDLAELVATHNDPHSNEDLIELQNNPIYDEKEQVEEKVLSSGGIQNALSKIYSAQMKILWEMIDEDTWHLRIHDLHSNMLKKLAACKFRDLESPEETGGETNIVISL